MTTANENYRFNHDNRDVCLVDHLPHIFKNILDYRALSNASCVELEPLYRNVRTLLNDQFIDTASERAIGQWERYLKIVPNTSDTLEERRFRIQTRLNNIPPYTDRYLENRLNELCGSDNWRIYRDYDNYMLTVEISSSSAANTRTVADIVRAIVPANMNLVVQEYRSRYSELVNFSHEHLAKYTYDEIKYNAVFDQPK